MVMQRAGAPWTGRAPEDRRQHHRAEDAAVMPSLEDLGRDGAHYRGQAIAERPLGRDHQVEQRRRGVAAERDQGEAAQDEAAIADHPYRLAPDAIGQMAERDL